MGYNIDYEHIYNCSPDMCFSVEAMTGRIVSCNQTLVDTLGYTKQECLALPLINFYHPNYHEKVKENLASFSTTGKIIHTEFILVKKDGKLLEVSLQFTPVKDREGNTLYSNAVWRDITIEKKTSRALEAEKVRGDRQNAIIAEKNRDILASIKYAKRIQNAILPSARSIKHALPESFILYKPKDIVAGDFYWIEKTENGLVFAVADCTGHGVPGALVSIICNGALNHSIREFKLNKPCEILEKTRTLVLKEFEKSEQGVSDGMDIGLCKLNSDKLLFSGANNPLWLVRNGQLIEYKGDKQSIGKSYNYYPFLVHEVVLEKGDTFYLMTDGFQDQFGGPNGKKFKRRKLKEFLLTIQNYTMSQQQELLLKEFDSWKGDLEQVDDVCVMGFRV